MTKREYKYLKGDKWMSWFGGEPFLVPAKHWFMRRRIARMTVAQYIRWKQQQCIQQDLNDLSNKGSAWQDTPMFGKAFWYFPENKNPVTEVPHIEYFIPGKPSIISTEFPRTVNLTFDPEFTEKINQDLSKWQEAIRNAKPTETPNVQGSDTTDP